MNIHRLYHLFFKYFRPRRMRQFYHAFSPNTLSRVLDVGGTPFNWYLLRDMPRPQLFMVNLPPLPKGRDKSVNWIIADGRYLPFKDAAFDIVYSNSVIEHLETFTNQRLFANECRRAGKNIMCKHKRFLVEPHLITPFIHYLPKVVQRRLLRNFTIWGLVTRPSAQQCDNFLREVRLLDERALREMFPDAEIWRERVFGITKSLIASKITNRR